MRAGRYENGRCDGPAMLVRANLLPSTDTERAWLDPSRRRESACDRRRRAQLSVASSARHPSEDIHDPHTNDNAQRIANRCPRHGCRLLIDALRNRECMPTAAPDSARKRRAETHDLRWRLAPPLRYRGLAAMQPQAEGNRTFGVTAPTTKPTGTSSCCQQSRSRSASPATRLRTDSGHLWGGEHATTTDRTKR